MNIVTVGIAGGSGSGKTTLARELVERLGASRVVVVMHDAYYKDLSFLPFEERAAANFDHPDALDTALCARHIRDLRAGRTVEQPVYDFASHTRTLQVLRIEPKPVVILDGILILAEPALRELLDIRVFVEAGEKTRFERRLARDTRERGRTPASVFRQWRETVQPMYERFVEPSRPYAHVILPFETANPVGVDILAAFISLRAFPRAAEH
ncbi:MAG: uridine kinase [Bacteroidota bacterium]|nr:uridine kinase [Bacteroidota bacterium]